MEKIIIQKHEISQTHFPKKLESVFTNAEFSIITRSLNKYKSFDKRFLFFIFFIVVGIIMIIAGGVLVGKKSLNRESDKFWGIESETDDGLDPTEMALFIVGAITTLFGIIVLSVYGFKSSSNYKKNIKKELSIINENYKPRGIKFDYEFEGNKFKIIISFPTSIQTLENPITIFNETSQNYAPSAPPMASNGYESYYPSAPPQSNEIPKSTPHPQYSYEASTSSSPYHPNNNEASTSSSPYHPNNNGASTFSSPYHPNNNEASTSSSPYHPNNNEAVSVPLPQEILDMIEKEESSKNIEMNRF